MSENSPEGQPEFIQRLIAKYNARREAGEDLTQEEFLQEHSEHSTLLRAEFAILNSNSDIGETVVHSPDKDDDSTSLQTVVHGTNDSETSIPGQNVSSSNNQIDMTSLQSFGRYEIKKVLGQGAMGSVYLARDVQLDRDVALKIPKFDGNDVNREELLERFYREARAAATLRSPNICPVYDVGEINGQHYITMAYIEGRPLKDFTKSSKRHSEKQVAVTIRKLALGLAEAHEIGVIHRDLKPANIMVDKKSEPVVMDFGLARRSSSDDVQMTQSGVILGTPAYMAPEQVEGDPEKIGPHTDIYALGVIMYELITGQLPFRGNLMSILQQIALNNPAPPSEMREGLDPRLETICLKLMAGEIKDRYQSMEDVAADLQEYIKNPNKRPPQRRSDETFFSGADASRSQVSNPALITIEEPKSFAEQLREKSNKPSRAPRMRPVPNGENAGSGSRIMLIAGGLGGIILLLGIFFLVRIGKYDVQLTVDDPSIKLSVDDDAVRIDDGTGTIRLSAGKHKLKLEKDGLTTEVDEFTVTKDGKTTLYVTVLDNKLAMRTKRVSRTPPTDTPNSQASIPEEHENYGLVLSRDEFVDLSPESLKYDGSNPLTFECWMGFAGDYPTAVGDGAVKLFGCGAYLWSELIPLVGSSGSPIPYLHAFASDGVEDGEKFARVPISAENTDLMHFACVYSGNTYTVFLNGQRIADPQPFSYKIGRVQAFGLYAQLLQSAATRDYQVLFDEVRISNTARYTYEFEPQRRFEPDDDTLALYHFDESGNVLTDSSGNGHYAMIGSATRVALDQWPPKTSPNSEVSPAFSNRAMSFDGADDYVVVDSLNLADYPPSSPLTLEMTVNLTNTRNCNMLSWLGADWIAFYQSNGHWGVGQLDGETSRLNQVSAQVELDKAVQLAAVRENGQWTIFIDGIKQEMQPQGFELQPTEGGLYLGGVPRELLTGHEEGRWMAGAMDEVRISTSARYQSNYLPAHFLTADDQTLALYHFDEGERLVDSSGNEHHGKIVGATWTADSSINELASGRRFHSRDDIITVEGLGLTPDEPFTMEAWCTVPPSRGGDAESQVIAHLAPFELKGYREKASSVLKWEFVARGFHDSESSGVTSFVIPETEAVGTRHHIAGVWDGEMIKLYLDGVPSGHMSSWNPSANNHEATIQTLIKQEWTDTLCLGDESSSVHARLPRPDNSLFAGELFSLRISKGMRYQQPFQPTEFQNDEQTVALYHFTPNQTETFPDLSGHGHDGKLERTSKPGANAMLKFEPGDGVIFPGLVDDTESLTMECWLQIDHDTMRERAHAFILGTWQDYGIFTDSSTGSITPRCREPDGPTNSYIRAPLDAATQKLAHFAVVRDAQKKEHRFYVDGKLLGRMQLGDVHKGQAFHLCGREYQWGQETGHGFAGLIDEVRISSVARYDADFEPQRRFETDADTRALYHFDTGQGELAKDATGNGFGGQITGAEWVSDTH